MVNGFLGIVVIAAGLAAEPGVRVYTTLDPPEIPYHHAARYTITAEAPSEVALTLPELKDDFDGLDIAPGQITTEDLPGGRRRVAHIYVLDPVKVNVYLLPPVEVSWGDGQKLMVPGTALRVRELTETELELAGKFEGITGPEVVSPKRNPAPWVAGALAAALTAAAVAGYLWWRRRQAAEEAAPPLPPWEVAYRRLRELAARQLPEAGKYGPYYVDLSAILRYYIEDRFQLHAPEQTTPEFLDAAGRAGLLSEDHQGLLARFLRHCDRVKFAQYEPTPEEMEQSYAVVLQFVQETEIRPAVLEIEEAAA
jgi:hypothetical protein